MNISPSREEYLTLKKDFERVPVSGEREVSHFQPLHFFRSLFSESSHAFLFESGKGPEATARYSFIGESSQRTLQAGPGETLLSHNGTRETRSSSPEAVLDLLDFEMRQPPFHHTPHFWGGWVGYLGYELAQYLEHIRLRPKNDLGLPLLYFFEVDRLWVYDHKTRILKMIIAEKRPGDPEEDYDHKSEEIHRQWQKAQPSLTSPTPQEAKAHPPQSNGSRPEINSNISRKQYMDWVGRTRNYIKEGDIYQANLAQRFESVFEGDPLELYEHLRRINPSPFSGFLKFQDLMLVSSSPERLIKVQQGKLETRPIAGTRPRGKNSEEDDRLQAELLLNEKEQAEHMMLVDLERNDLGRICEYGSVRVTEQMCVEQYSHVSHIVSNIQGTLLPETRLKELLQAVFPGGTITGCPKIRCMEIIDELEPVTRGPYSGSFGYIGYDDTLDLNIIIRTIVLTQGKAYFHVGAGIVADSIAEKEYQETLDKAAAMIQVLSQKPDA